MRSATPIICDIERLLSEVLAEPAKGLADIRAFVRELVDQSHEDRRRGLVLVGPTGKCCIVSRLIRRAAETLPGTTVAIMDGPGDTECLRRNPALLHLHDGWAWTRVEVVRARLRSILGQDRILIERQGEAAYTHVLRSMVVGFVPEMACLDDLGATIRRRIRVVEVAGVSLPPVFYKQWHKAVEWPRVVATWARRDGEVGNV